MSRALRAANLLGMSRPQLGRRLSRHEASKFLLTTVAPALIQPEEADRLIDYIVDESVLFREATVERMTTNEKDIRFIDISGGVLRQATCGTVRETVTISNTNKCLRTISVDAEFYLCDDDMEDGLTGAQLESQVIRMTADQVSNEAENWGLMANTDGSYLSNANTSPVVVNNAVMGLRDGWYRQLQHGNLVDAASLDAGDRTLSFNKLRCLKTRMPTKYRTNMAAHRIYMASNMADNDYFGLHQGRPTDLGDAAHQGPFRLLSGTTPIVPVPMLPTDIQACGCGSLPDNGTFMFDTEPSNLVLGIERNITFERERVAREHRTWFIWTFRFDVLLFNEEASAMMDCMQLDDCGPGTCTPVALGTRCNTCLDSGSGGEPS